MNGSDRTVKIGLLWHSANSGNLGVGALTVGNIALVREAAARAGLTPKFTIIGFAPDYGEDYVTGPDIERLDINGRSLTSPGGYWRTLGGLDCVLDIGAGDSWTDIYPAKRFAYLWTTKAMAIARGVPLLLSPQTIGPFTREPYRTLAAAMMKRAEAVVARDPTSFDAARKMAPAARVTQAVDVAFKLPFDRRAQATDGMIPVGVNVSALLFNGGYSGANEFGLQVDYAALMRRLIGTLAARPDTRVHLICHVNSDALPVDDDGRVADRLAAEFPGVVRAPNFASPSDAKSYISGLDFLIAGRMHACIAAFSSGVPVIPIAYSRKFSGLFEGMLGYPHMVPAKGMSTDQALDYILAKIDERAALGEAIERGNQRAAAALGAYGDELDRLFARFRPEAGQAVRAQQISSLTAPSPSRFSSARL